MSLLCSSRKKIKEKRNYPVDAYTRSNSNHHENEITEEQEIEAGPTYLEIVEDYFPCSALELPVREGEIVWYIESEGLWIYVRAENGADGYIPRRHCRLIDLTELKISEPSDVGYYSDSKHDTYTRKSYVDDQIPTNNVRLHNNDVRQNHKNIPRRRHHHNDEHYHHPHQHQHHKHHRPRYHSMGNIQDDHTQEPLQLANYSLRSTSTDSTPPSNRHAETNRNRTFSNVGYYRQFGENRQQQQQQQHKTSSADKKPVCGRKCKDNCEHKFLNGTQKSTKTSKDSTGKNYSLRKSTVISVSSGRSFSHDERLVDQINSISEAHDGTNSSDNVEVSNNTNEQKEQNNTSNIIAENELGEDHNNNNSNSNDVSHHDNNENFNENENPGKMSDITRSKCGHPEIIVIENYQKQGETDITVNRGDYATIINDSKYKHWMYITNERGERGFIPTKCAIKHECHDCSHKNKTSSTLTTDKNANVERETNNESSCEYTEDDFDAMQQLIITEDYSGKNLDDLYVCIGDTVHMDPGEQSDEQWLWVHSLKLKCSGYIPKLISQRLDEIEHTMI